MMETYNREFNEKMGGHPSLFVFCDQLDTEIKRWVRKVEQARKGVMTERQGQASIQWPAIPNDFATFLSSYVSPNKKRKSPILPAGKIAKKKAARTSQ